MKTARFKHFIAIDWSGARGLRQNGIALAICSAGSDAPELVRSGHRWSRGEVLDWLVNDLPPDSLVGMDLSPALPFADAGAYFPGWEQSPDNARDLWQMVDALSEDEEGLSVQSFVTHPEASRHFRHGKGKCGDRFQPGAGRMRQTEHRQRLQRVTPTSCFNLVGAAQVGKSSLTGMRVLHRLGGHIPVWPFDPVPENGSLIVEIYTSLAAREAEIPPGRSKMRDPQALDQALANLGSSPHNPIPKYHDHATDSLLTSAWLRRAAHQPELWTPEGMDEFAQTEGWTFGVR